MTRARIRIGTRGSPLALWQARAVAAALRTQHGMSEADVEIVVIKTSGDRIQDRPLSEAGGKGLFTKEIEEALIDRTIDCAVHSMKDVETRLPDGLSIPCLLPREDVRDGFISGSSVTLQALPQGAVVGTSSLRRRAQVKRLRPDLEVVSLRGNVETRLKRLEEGRIAATLLAVAGLRRLGMADRLTAVMETTDMLPAVAQGAIGIEVRSDDQELALWLAPLNDAATALCVAAERSFLARLDGSCRTPIAALAVLDGSNISFRGMILTPDGAECHETSRAGRAAEALALADDAGRELLGRAGPGFFG